MLAVVDIGLEEFTLCLGLEKCSKRTMVSSELNLGLPAFRVGVLSCRSFIMSELVGLALVVTELVAFAFVLLELGVFELGIFELLTSEVVVMEIGCDASTSDA